MTPFDVITFGETMLRLTPPDEQLIEQSHSLTAHVGGSESNTIIGLARLDWRTAWFSHLTDNPLGRKIANTIRAHSVNTAYITWTDQHRVGLYFVEEGPPPRGGRVTYDRAHSAASHITPAHLPLDDVFKSAGWLHITGITPALSPTAAATTRTAVERAATAGCKISFDLNYRAKLWSIEDAAATCAPLIEQADLAFIPHRDAQTIYNTPSNPIAALNALHNRWPNTTIVMTLGADGAATITPDGDHHTQSAYPSPALGRIGGGDAFVAGYLSGLLEYDNHPSALQWANAAAAYKRTLPGDIPLLDRAALRRIIASVDTTQSLDR